MNIASIIIPFFNEFDKMKKCLAMLEKQTVKNFEVIFIDDCSEDGACKKLQEYLKTSLLKAHIIHNKRNLGPGESRNKGIELATGRYILFIDSDDYIETDTIEKIEFIYHIYHPECIVYDFNLCYEKKKKLKHSIAGFEEGKISVEEGLLYINTSTWCKVFLTEIIKKHNIKFPMLYRREDYVFTKVALSYCKTIYYYKFPLYNYIQNSKSLVHTKILNEQEADSVYELIQKDFYKHEKELKCIYIHAIVFLGTQDMLLSGKGIASIVKQCKKVEIQCGECKDDDYIKQYTKRLPYYTRVFFWLLKKKKHVSLVLWVKMKKFIKRII